MLLVERETKIVDHINKHGVATVRELAELFDVTDVTIRRDLKRLEELNLIERTHGGATSPTYQAEQSSLHMGGKNEAPLNHATDALIITPIQSRVAHTLRKRALRDRIPLIAESTPQEGAIYLGTNNFAAAYSLGQWTGEYYLAHRDGTAHVLNITYNELTDTQQRSKGFKEGLQSVLGEQCIFTSIDGRAMYHDVYQIAQDALQTHPEIDILFGVNDDSTLGGIQAYLDLGRDPDHLIAVGTGAEGKTLLNMLNRGGCLKASLAMFPEVVGRLAIDAIVHLWNGGTIDEDVFTPTVILTPDNLTQYYTPVGHEWQLNPEALEDQLQYDWLPVEAPSIERESKQITFLIVYRTHEWYQNLAKAMEHRAKEVGAQFSVEDLNDDIRAEIRELRRLIGKMAASYVDEGDKIILDAGTPTRFMAQFLRGMRDITVITNSMEVFQQLYTDPHVKLILIGGEYQNESQSTVGFGSHLLLEEIRADKAFVVAGGLSESFGISSVTEGEADVRRSMMKAAREVIVLADHSVIDVDSNVRVAELENIDTVITDPGVLASQSLKLSQNNIKVVVAGEYKH